MKRGREEEGEREGERGEEERGEERGRERGRGGEGERKVGAEHESH